jgi:putative lipoprotein (rSAM/lipoprotein system)
MRYFTNKFNKSVYRRLILLLGVIMGFSTSIVAQYGAPTAHYKVSGTIRSKICEEPIPKIKVTVYQSQYKNYNDPVYTDSAGHFEYIYESDEWSEKLKLHISAEDTDGKENKGDFLPLEKEVNVVRYSYYGNKSNSEKDDQTFQMVYSGKPPCKDEIQTDTVYMPIPMIKLSDSIILEPEKIAETYNNVLVDSINQITAPAVLNDEVFIVFPNPSDGVYFIKQNNNQQSLLSVYVYDSNSKMIYYNIWNKVEREIEMKIDLAAFSSGTYYLVLFSGTDKYMKKLIME